MLSSEPKPENAPGISRPVAHEFRIKTLTSTSSYQGTNCYLIQAPNDATQVFLLDAGSGRPTSQQFASLLLQELKQLGHDSALTDILITHRDEDHVGGLPDLMQALADAGQRPPRIHKYRHTIEAHNNRDYDAELAAALPGGLHQRTEDERDIHLLEDGQSFVLRSKANPEETTTLDIIYTPGHTNDSISLLLREEEAIFTGDTVLG
jgi:glyoxylase-like metal-dependent hydrolase (beta-lactamase superfamily II)